jgi:hypothetical protein
MNDDRMIVDMIERASDAQPMCACGRHTTAVWRDGIVWLECATLLEPRDGRLERLLAAVTAPVHTRVQIVEVPAAAA